MADKVPGKAWVVVFCGTAVNLCLGILYAWSVWSGKLICSGQLITEGRRWVDLPDQREAYAIFVVRNYLPY
jgi:hypothetical protein